MVYPKNNLVNSAIVDQWLEQHTEFMFPLQLNMYPSSMGLELTDEKKAEHRQWLINNHIPKHFNFIEKELSNNDWICTNTKSVADYCWLATFRWLYSGIFDSVTKSYFDDYPEIKSYLLRNIESCTVKDDNEDNEKEVYEGAYSEDENEDSPSEKNNEDGENKNKDE